MLAWCACALLVARGADADPPHAAPTHLSAAIGRASGTARPALTRALGTSYPGVASRASSRGGLRVQRAARARGIGVRQRVVAGARGGLTLRTRLAARVRHEQPALATLLEAHPDLVVTDRLPDDTFELQGPSREGPSGRVHDRIRVAANGRTTAQTLDERSGSVVPDSERLLSRDWGAHPAVLEIPATDEIYVVTDVHGGYDRLVRLLVRHGLIARAPAHPGEVEWTGGHATLVEGGDAFDKGTGGLEVMDLMRALEPRAAAAGGRVVAMMGNHEGEFMASPENAKATAVDGIDRELAARHMTPDQLADSSDPRSQWLRALPFAVRVGRAPGKVSGIGFVHSGNLQGWSPAEAESRLATAVDTEGYRSPTLTGPDSVLESRGWYKSAALVRRNAQAFGVDRVVFGHDPSALGPKGRIVQAFDGALFRVDTGMSPEVNYSHGALLRLRIEGKGLVAHSLGADGREREIWREKTPR